MSERETFREMYLKGKIAKVRREVGGRELSMGEVFQKVPDISLQELMVAAGMTIEPNGTNNQSEGAFKDIQRTLVLDWIDNGYQSAPDVAGRLIKELHSDLP